MAQVSLKQPMYFQYKKPAIAPITNPATYILLFLIQSFISENFNVTDFDYFKNNSLIIINAPIINTNQPKPFFRIAPLTCLFKALPNKMPMMAIVVTVSISGHSILFKPWLLKKPARELSDIISKEVPIAFFIGSFIKNTSAGINKKPPPAPKNPVTNPTIIPKKISLGKFCFSLVED